MRRMLLTSSGITNDAIRSALADLIGSSFKGTRVVFIPTASVASSGDHTWVVEDLRRLHDLHWRELDILELNGLPSEVVVSRLRHADVIYVEGGNHYHLANSIVANDLAEPLTRILESKVYVGVSAGSMIFSRNLSERTGAAFSEQDDLRILGDTAVRPPFGFFDWYLKPHLNSRDFPNRNLGWFRKAAAQLDFPVYAIDDHSAVRVRGADTDVVSTGNWQLLNPPAEDAADGDRPPPGAAGRRRRLLPLRLPR